MASKDDQDRHASLLKLAEQTVVEADKLAESIKEQAKKEAEEERAKIVSAAREEAKAAAERVTSRAEREAADQIETAVKKAEQDANEILANARKDSDRILQAAREKLPGIESAAKLEAEYIVRRFTVNFVEEIRSAVTEAAEQMLPNLDDLMKRSGQQGVLQEGADGKAASQGRPSRPRSSSKS